MITSVRLVNFKNFGDETLRVGPFTVIVGANASGKSNVRDAFRFLHGIGRGYTLAETLGGKYGQGAYVEWMGIRGAMGEIARLGQEGFSITLEAETDERNLIYTLEAENDDSRSGAFRVSHEELRDGNKIVYAGRGFPGSLWVKSAMDKEGNYQVGQPFRSEQPALLQETAMLGEERNIDGRPVNEMRSILGSMRFLDLVPDHIKEPSFPGRDVLGDTGENLPSVLEAICADAERERTVMSWVQELTPMDVKELEFPRDPSGRVHLYIVERNGRRISAYSVSDGTLRFLAMLATLLDPKPAGIYFFEEIDNGIHPSRLWLLLELIEMQTARDGIQVITTAHSPALLSWISDEAFEHTSIVYRDEYWSDSVIRPVADLYDLRELRKSRTLGELHTEGWLDTAMKCKEGTAGAAHPEEEHDDETEENRP